MAKFIEDRSSLKKKKKKETTTQKVAAPSSANKKQTQNVANQVVNRTANAAKRTTNTVGNSAQRQNTVRRNVQKAVAENAPQRYNNRPSGAAQPSTNHTVQDRLAASRQRREQAEADIKRRRQETEARSQRISQSRNPRMQDTARGTKMPTLEERRQKQDRLRQAQEQKMGNNSMASKEAQRTANRALKNTPTVAKESAKQVGIGHGKTFADITEANKSAAIGSKIDIKSKEFQEDIEKRRKESTRVAKSSFKTLSDMQEDSEEKMQKVTKDAKGLEKAYYGALESGVGMATDRLAGPAWAVSMLSRTYGNTRGQAQKEGATEDEDRAYSLLQAAKEVATEYMFQGVGLAKGLSGRHSLSLGETAANAITKNMRGPLANATHAGIRLLGGVGEENLEEVAGWGLDPFIKEFTYGRNARTRQAQQMMRDQSDALRSNITNMDDARAVAAYLSSDDFLEQQVRTYMDSGIGKEEARDLAENMRDYLDASLSGDTDRMADIEESLSKKLSGRSVKDILKEDLSLSELKDTIESTTLLTATTGLPGTVTTTARGAAIKEQLGTDGIRALAKTAEDFEDGEMQLKAKAMSDRLDAGKDITSTQAYDLAVGVQEQYNKDADRQQTAYQTAQKTIKSEKLVTPYRVSRDGDIQMDEVTDKTYQSTAKSAKSAIETFIENSEGKESLTDTEIDRGSRAIAGFKTGVFTVDDANELNFRNTAVRSAFEKETGVDLSEYVVKGKDGQIDIPATNTATKNALFAQAADNLVATAQAETANWVDNTKGEVVTQISRRMGASGTAALQTALDDVDERDRSSYMMTANASDVLYQSARNMGTEWENAKDYAKKMFPNVAEDKLKAMYEAGLADRDMATDEARGQQIKIGEKVELKKNNEAPTGQVIIETSAPVKGSVIRTFTELARNLGVDIHLVDHFADKDGKVLKNVNGEYIDGNIFINVNSDFEKNMGFIFMHEVTHHLKMYAPEQYKALEDLVREKWFKYDSAQMQSEIAKKIETYAKHGQKLTEEQALEEIIADAAHEFLTDRNFAREIANEDASLAQAVLTSIRNALRMLRRIMSADGLDETHMNTLFSQLDILDEAERLWLDAYKQAVRNNAAVEVDRLQNQIYEEGRKSVSDYSQEEMDAHRQALVDEMSEYYSSPYTDNYAEAGFVFPDGQMLRMGMDGQRGEDHRIASHAYDDISDREDALNSFINEGNIRWMPELSTMEFGVSSEPTAEQYEWIRDVARNYSTMSGMLQGIREIDFTDKNGETVESKIVTNESADSIVNTIKRFYKTGTAEGGSQLSQFRYSISDSDYMDAVNRGDTKSAQKMVDKAAKNAGFTVKGYHGTTNNFNTFRSGDIGFHFGKNKSTARTRVGRGKSAKIIPAWLSLDNPIKIDVDFGSWDADYRLAEYLRDEGIITPEEYQDALTVDNGTRRIKRSTKGANDALRNILKGKGYDGIEYENYYEAEGATSYIVFDAAQIKNADPVTYDDNGDVIPLSERFNQSSPDIRYSIADMPSIDDLDMTNSTVEDENGDMVAEFQDNGSVRFSISSFEKSGRAIYQDYLNKQVKNGNLSRKEADDMMHELETVYGIAKEFADKTDENGDPIYAPFSAWSYADVVTDEKGKPVFSAIKKNSEYKMNIDFSTICKKRRTLDAVFREMINRGMFEKLDLNKDESAAMVVNINNLIRQHKFEAACALCFVEARRYRQQQTATTFRDMWNSIVESMYTGNNKAEYFNFGEDSTVEAVPNAIHTLDDSELDLTYVKKLANEKDDKGKLKQTAEAKAARLMLKDPSQRKLMRVGDMMASTGFENMQIKNPELMKVYNSKKGTGGAKSSFGDVQYLNEILKPRSFSRKSAYAVSGVRIQSFSDYVPRMVFDYVQVIADLAAKHLPAHGYTKEPLFVKQFGLTGAKINMSLVPDVAADSDIPGLDKDGNYIWNEEGTFPYDEAMAIQEAEGYKENCGTIAVGISDEHIMKMLADPTIQMVIPYHKSSLNPIVAAMTNVDRFENYEKFQTTKDENGNAVSKDFDWDNKLFRLSHDSKGKMLPKEQWGNVQDLVKEYADWCEQKSYTPKFEKFLYQRKDNKADGEILTDENGNKLINPGYYKLLEDFALLDNDGNFKPQGDVQMRFPTEDSAFDSMKDLIAQGLSEDTELEAKRSSEISGIVDEIEGMFDQGTLTEQSATSEKLAARMSISLDTSKEKDIFGNPLSEGQREFFANTKAVTKYGSLMPLYHGTGTAGFNVFDTSRKSSFRPGLIWLTTSRADADSYAGNWEHKLYDPEERETRETMTAGNFTLADINHTYAYMRFDTEEDRQQFIDEHPDIDKAHDYWELDDMNFNDEIDDDEFNRLKNADERIRVDYARYEAGHSMPATWGDVFDHPEWFEKRDLARALLAYDSNIAIDEDREDTKEDLLEYMRYVDSGEESGEEPGYMRNLKFDARIPAGQTREYVHTVNNRTYEVYANITNPLEVDLHGDGIEGNYNYVDEMLAGDYDGLILRNCRVGRYHRNGDVVIAKESSQVKLTTNQNPTSDPDIRYSINSDGEELTKGQADYFANSQARDENGRLVPVYHATSVGGFTIFDPSYSDDRRSLFFSNKKDVANTYVGKYLYADEDRLGDGDTELTSWNQLLDYARDAYLAAGLDWDNDLTPDNLDWGLYRKDNGKAANFELADSYEDDYKTWLELAQKDDPKIANYKVSIRIPYDIGEEIEWNRYEGDSLEDLLNKVSADPVPQAGYYQVYLNLENPMIIDGKGAYWDSISLDSRIPSNTRLELITGEYLDALAESIEQQFMDEKNQREKHGYKFKDESLYTWPQYQKSKQYRKDAKEAKKNGIAYLKTETGERIRAEYSPEGLAKAINTYYGFEENDSEGMLIANGMLKEIGSGMDAHSYKGAAQLRELTGETHDTREWAEKAQAEGYDGVIFRNIVDVDSKTEIDEDDALSDIFIAFSSNQVKDTRNENPTENPDIRYSITEDEGKSKKDYEHATDMSYEELLMYEDMIANASESYDIESAFGKAFDGEKVSNFYSALTEEVGMVFDDEILEEGRMRMAKSKADFWSNLNTKWQERWETKGEVLDTKSVKTNVRNLIRGVMNNSNTDRQYKTDLLNKTLMDMRVAYQLMKQDRTDIASALLYHSALRMITDVDFIQDDTEYQEYKGIRDYLRGEPITVGEDYWQSKAFQQFRKEHYGILKLRKGANGNIGEVYAQLENLYPHIFSETEREKHGFGDAEEDLLQYIGFVTEQNMQPFMEAYSSEYCADWAFEIADDLYEIMENGEGVTSLADRYKEKYDAKAKAMKTRHAEAILRVRKQKQAAIDALKEQYNERLDEQKNRYNEKLDQQKEQYSERLNSQKIRARDAIRRERERFRQQKQDEKERTKERRLHSKYFDSIVKSHKTLSDRLLTNTKDKHIPEQYKKDLAELLAAFDLQTVASKKLEIRNGLYYRQNYQSQKTIRMKALQETLANIQADSQLFYVNDSITEIIDRLLGKNAEGKTDPTKSVEGRTIDELTASELKDIDNLLKALIHEFNNYESVRTGAKRQQAADIATSQIDSCLDHAGKFGEGLDYQNFLGALDNILNLDEVTPAYMFRQIDPQNNGIGMMFKELRRSFGKYVRNQNQLNEWMNEIIGEYNNKGRLWNKYGSALEEWRVSTRAKEFQLTNGNVKLTPAQMMSIYCLSHRQQAYDHMTGAGIVVQPVSFQAKMASDLRKRANYALPVILTDSDIKLITSKLTPDQIKVADKLQELMATKMAEWGNEASMSVMGIRLFEDPDYFPIKSDKAALEKDFSAEQFMDCIRNFGFTKAVQPGARNAIAIGDIFDVVAEHCNNMNLYNAYSEAMNDFMKVYNFHAMREDGSDYSVEQAIAHAYSKKATTFISTFMKDLNGNVSRERTTGIEQMLNDSLGKAKKASVFANGRVALQQPTALMRAFAVINPKYLKGVKAGKATMQEMFEHSPIALWKSWGYYDINMGKSIEDLMMNNGSWAEDKMSDLYGELDNRTWAIIWTMCKNEVEDKHKDVEVGSDEYWELVSERFDEVVDLTQVVDSPFHRSHAMRSKNTFTKTATAFMAEPTLTYNMVRDGFRRAKEELRLGNKGKAGKIFGRTVAVFALSAGATAAAAAIWDAVRGKDPGDDDDKDKSFFDLWYANMLENLKDNINLLNNIYYVKDVVSLFQGWDQRDLGLQGWKHLADAYGQLTGRKVSSKLSWYENLLSGIGYLSGIPFKTMMSDGKAIFKMFGLTTPKLLQDQLDKLDSLGQSAKDMNSGKSSSSGVSSAKKSSETREGESKSASVNLWTYDNAPFHIEDGSLADKFLNHFGINLTSAEIAAIENAEAEKKRDAKIADIKERTADLTGEAKTKKVWSMVTSYAKEENNGKSMSEFIHDGDYNTINRIKGMYIKAGGDPDYFKERVFATSKTELKKTISADNTEAQIEAQQHIKDYLLQSGMSEAELSEIAYKSYTNKDLQVAIRIGDADAAVTELRALLEAGLSDEDFYRIWDNRNSINIAKYRESGGKYADRLKSTGVYNWPINGTITSNFGHRSSPGGIGSTNHQGLDIAGSMGQPVTASDGGVVIMAKWYGGAGKTVQIQHDDGTITQYSHLSWWEPKVGDVVAQGQEIGKVGSTGNSTGPHLHFGVIKNGSYVDPMTYLNKKS